MAATFVNDGVNPVTGSRVVSEEATQITLAVLSTCRLYDGSGEAAVHLGIPAKPGVGGGVMGVVNRDMGIAVYSPPLDTHGNSVRGFQTLQRLSKELDLHTHSAKGDGQQRSPARRQGGHCHDRRNGHVAAHSSSSGVPNRIDARW